MNQIIAWMIRAYALAQGAGTQALIFLPVMLISGPVLGVTRDVLLSAAWVVNLVAAEWLILRRSRLPQARRAASRTTEQAAATNGSWDRLARTANRMRTGRSIS